MRQGGNAGVDCALGEDMKFSRMFVLVIVWAASLLGVGLWAQGGRAPQPAPAIQMGEPIGEILTGENIGFQRVAAPPDRDGKVVGRLMVKINGRWTPVASAFGVVR